MATLTELRRNVQAAMQTAFGFTFVGGRLEGPSEDRNVGCVWVLGKREANPATDEEVLFGVRVFQQWAPREGSTNSPNANELEAFCDLVQDTIAPIITTLGMWMCRVVELEILYEQSGIEATLLGRQLNRGGY